MTEGHLNCGRMMARRDFERDSFITGGNWMFGERQGFDGENISYKNEKDMPIPIRMSKPADLILDIIFCARKKWCRTSYGFIKNGLMGNVACTYCIGINCTNVKQLRWKMTLYKNKRVLICQVRTCHIMSPMICRNNIV